MAVLLLLLRDIKAQGNIAVLKSSIQSRQGIKTGANSTQIYTDKANNGVNNILLCDEFSPLRLCKISGALFIYCGSGVKPAFLLVFFHPHWSFFTHIGFFLPILVFFYPYWSIHFGKRKLILVVGLDLGTRQNEVFCSF